MEGAIKKINRYVKDYIKYVEEEIVNHQYIFSNYNSDKDNLIIKLNGTIKIEHPGNLSTVFCGEVMSFHTWNNTFNKRWCYNGKDNSGKN